MNKIHNFIGEQIIKYIFRHGGMITVQRKAGAVQVAKVYSKADYQNIKTNADRIRSFSDEELAEWLTNMCDFINPEDEEPYKSIYNIDTEKEETVHDSYGSIRKHF